MSEDYTPQLLTSEDVFSVQFPATKFRDGYDQNQIDDYLDEVVRVLSYYEALNASPEAEVDLAYITVRGRDVREVDFDYTRMRVGYDQDAVDDYLDQVAATLEAYENLYGIPPSQQRYQVLQVDGAALEAAAQEQAVKDGELPLPPENAAAEPPAPADGTAAGGVTTASEESASAVPVNAVPANPAPASPESPRPENPSAERDNPELRSSVLGTPTGAFPVVGANGTSFDSALNGSELPGYGAAPQYPPMDISGMFPAVNAGAASNDGDVAEGPRETSEATTGEMPEDSPEAPAGEAPSSPEKATPPSAFSQEDSTSAITAPVGIPQPSLPEPTSTSLDEPLDAETSAEDEDSIFDYASLDLEPEDEAEFEDAAFDSEVEEPEEDSFSEYNSVSSANEDDLADEDPELAPVFSRGSEAGGHEADTASSEPSDWEDSETGFEPAPERDSGDLEGYAPLQQFAEPDNSPERQGASEAEEASRMAFADSGFPNAAPDNTAYPPANQPYEGYPYQGYDQGQPAYNAGQQNYDPNWAYGYPQPSAPPAPQTAPGFPGYAEAYPGYPSPEYPDGNYYGEETSADAETWGQTELETENRAEGTSVAGEPPRPTLGDSGIGDSKSEEAPASEGLTDGGLEAPADERLESPETAEIPEEAETSGIYAAPGASGTYPAPDSPETPEPTRVTDRAEFGGSALAEPALAEPAHDATATGKFAAPWGENDPSYAAATPLTDVVTPPLPTPGVGIDLAAQQQAARDGSAAEFSPVPTEASPATPEEPGESPWPPSSAAFTALDQAGQAPQTREASLKNSVAAANQADSVAKPNHNRQAPAPDSATEGLGFVSPSTPIPQGPVFTEVPIDHEAAAAQASALQAEEALAESPETTSEAAAEAVLATDQATAEETPEKLEADVTAGSGAGSGSGLGSEPAAEPDADATEKSKATNPRPLLQGEQPLGEVTAEGRFVPHFLAGYRSNLDTFTSAYGSLEERLHPRTQKAESIAKLEAEQPRKSITTAYLVTVTTSRPLGSDDAVLVRLPDGREVPVTSASSDFNGVHLHIPHL